jgi:hypothetical protein
MAEIAAGFGHAVSFVGSVGYLVSVNLGVEQEERLFQDFTVRAFDGCEEPVPEFGIARIQTERIGRLGQLRKQAHETDEVLALFRRMLVPPGQAPEALGDAVSMCR